MLPGEGKERLALCGDRRGIPRRTSTSATPAAGDHLEGEESEQRGAAAPPRWPGRGAAGARALLTDASS